MLSAFETDKLGGRKMLPNPMCPETGICPEDMPPLEDIPEDGMAYIQPYPFTNREKAIHRYKPVGKPYNMPVGWTPECRKYGICDYHQWRKRPISDFKKMGGFRVGKVLYMNRDKLGAGFLDMIKKFTTKSVLPVLLRSVVSLFARDSKDARMIVEALMPIVESLGTSALEFLITNAEKGFTYLYEKLLGKAEESDIKLLKKIKGRGYTRKTIKHGRPQDDLITLDEYILKNHKKLGRGFNDDIGNALIWFSKNLLAPFAELAVPIPVVGSAIGKFVGSAPEYMAERLSPGYTYKSPFDADDDDDETTTTPSRVIEKPRAAREKAVSSRTRRGGRYFDPKKGFFRNHLMPIIEGSAEIARDALFNVAMSKLAGEKNFMEEIRDDIRAARAARPRRPPAAAPAAELPVAQPARRPAVGAVGRPAGRPPASQFVLPEPAPPSRIPADAGTYNPFLASAGLSRGQIISRPQQSSSDLEMKMPRQPPTLVLARREPALIPASGTQTPSTSAPTPGSTKAPTPIGKANLLPAYLTPSGQNTPGSRITYSESSTPAKPSIPTIRQRGRPKISESQMRDLEIIREAQQRAVSRPRTPSPEKPRQPLTREQTAALEKMRQRDTYVPPNVFQRGLQSVAGKTLQLFEPLIINRIDAAGNEAEAERERRFAANRALLLARRAEVAAEIAAEKAAKEAKKPKGGRMCYKKGGRMCCAKCKKGSGMCCTKCKTGKGKKSMKSKKSKN